MIYISVLNFWTCCFWTCCHVSSWAPPEKCSREQNNAFTVTRHMHGFSGRKQLGKSLEGDIYNHAWLCFSLFWSVIRTLFSRTHAINCVHYEILGIFLMSNSLVVSFPNWENLHLFFHRWITGISFCITFYATVRKRSFWGGSFEEYRFYLFLSLAIIWHYHGKQNILHNLWRSPAQRNTFSMGD